MFINQNKIINKQLISSPYVIFYYDKRFANIALELPILRNDKTRVLVDRFVQSNHELFFTLRSRRSLWQGNRCTTERSLCDKRTVVWLEGHKVKDRFKPRGSQENHANAAIRNPNGMQYIVWQSRREWGLETLLVMPQKLFRLKRYEKDEKTAWVAENN